MLFFKKIRKETFLQNVLMLVGSTIFAQAIMIAILPILTRLYTPNDFGVFGVYTSMVAIFSTCACLRYDIPIALTNNQIRANTLLFISITISTLFCFFLLGLIFLFEDYLNSYLKDSEFLYCVPFGVFFISIFAALTSWKARKKEFKSISIVRCKQSIVGGLVQILGGLFFSSKGALFLIIGYLINSFFGIFKFFLEFYKEFIFKKKHILSTLNHYRVYPKYSTIEALLNNLAIYFPLIFIGKYISIEETGFLVLAIKLMQIPMKLVGNSIAQVFAVSASERYRDGKLKDFTHNTLNKLVMIGVGPIVSIGILAPEFCRIIFGDDWVRIGFIISLMIPWFLVQFLASPIAMILHITNNQKKALLLQIANVSIRVLPLFIIVSLSYDYLTEYYAFSGFLFYTIYLLTSLKLASLSVKSLVTIIFNNIHILFLWIFFSFIIKILINQIY